MVDEVIELIYEYQYLFPLKLKELKGIVRDLGVMKITLNPTRSQLSKDVTVSIQSIRKRYT